jgi:hypothetical protein
MSGKLFWGVRLAFGSPLPERQKRRSNPMKRMFLIATLVAFATAITAPVGKLLGFNHTASAACMQGGQDDFQGNEGLGDDQGNQNCNDQK